MWSSSSPRAVETSPSARRHNASRAPFSPRRTLVLGLTVGFMERAPAVAVRRSCRTPCQPPSSPLGPSGSDRKRIGSRGLVLDRMPHQNHARVPPFARRLHPRGRVRSARRDPGGTLRGGWRWPRDSARANRVGPRGRSGEGGPDLHFGRCQGPRFTQAAAPLIRARALLHRRTSGHRPAGWRPGALYSFSRGTTHHRTLRSSGFNQRRLM